MITSDQLTKISPEQVATYHQQGFLIIRDQVLSLDKFIGLKDQFKKILENLHPEHRPELMDMPHLLYPELFHWIFDHELLDLVEPIVGPDIALWASAFLCKPKGNGKRVPWHEDSSYWKTMISPMEVCTVWLAIDPSSLANGCMQVIPNSHATGKQGFSDYKDVDPVKNVFGNEIVENQRETKRAVPIELEPGQASLHDARIIHGSEPNNSHLRRCGFTIRFMSTQVKFNHEKHGSHHKIYLARGRDLAGNVYGDPTRSYEEIARFRVSHGKTGH